MSRTLRLAVLAQLVVFLVIFTGCGGSQPLSSTPDGNPSLSAESATETSWPSTLPADALQPWETRETSGVNADSILAAGIEWFDTSIAGVSDNHDASRMTSGDAGSKELSWATYRLRLQGTQPGVVSLDVNPLPKSDGTQSAYWVGLADYAAGCWEWHGPMSDNNVRFGTADAVADGADYLSDVGNLFVCVVAHDGAAFDVVCVGANPLDGDTTTPDAPANLVAAAVSGGLALTWDAMSAADLAGYRVYYCDEAFTLKDHPGVKTLDTLAGVAHLILPATAETWVAVTAVDVSGNESALSNVVSAAPLSGDMPVIQVTASLPSCLVRSSVDLAAIGADRYDWDLDGDGVFEVTGDTTGLQEAYTGIVGVVRPAVLGYTGAAGLAGGGVSVMLGTNSRPAASATANPQSGQAPLTVTFTGEAADVEDSLEDLDFAWDFDGDGIYEANTDTLTPSAQEYTTPGIFGVKFRVSDTQGEWDVDTVPVLVQAADDPDNVAPVADLSADVTSGDAPLAVEFDASGSTDSDGTIVEYAWDWDGNGGYEEITLSAVHSHVFTASGSPAVIVGVKDDDGAWDTATVAIDVNAPPVAALTVTPEDGIDPGEPIYLYAAGSSDSDGSIADYEWDFDNDGTYNETNNDEDDAQGLDNVILSPEDIGDYTVGLRVTDDDGATHATIADFTVHGWLVVTVDSAGNVGYDNSLAVVDGCPAISYYDNTNKDLKYARATTSTGASASDWSQIVTVESSAGTIGLYTSLAVVDGCPAISYYDSTNDNLKYARATTSTGGSTSGWTQKVVVDYTGDVGRYTSLAVIDGCPAISYFDSTNDDLKYARATTGTGASASDWTQIVTVDSTGNVGFITSLAVVDGYPAISYYDQSNQDLKYARATTSTGGSASDWTQIVTVDSTGNVGDFTSLAVVAGCPAISYLDTSNFDLKYARATTSTGGSVGDWTQIITVESTGIVGLYSSLAIINGCPMIAYQDDSNNKVRFATSSTVTGSDSADWSMESPATGATTGEYSSLAEVNGYAAASFYDAVSDDLRYAILF